MLEHANQMGKHFLSLKQYVHYKRYYYYFLHSMKVEKNKDTEMDHLYYLHYNENC